MCQYTDIQTLGLDVLTCEQSCSWHETLEQSDLDAAWALMEQEQAEAQASATE